MNIKLEAFMEGCPHSGFVAWIENSRNFNMTVQGKTPEEATNELIKSLKVSMAYTFGVEVKSIDERVGDHEIYLQLFNGLKETGKKELNFSLESA